LRKINPGDSQPGTLGYETRNNNPVYSTGNPAMMSGIDETIEANTQSLNPSNDNLTPPPPPPPPAPPILKELQHLATPPPPPPAPIAPLYRHNDPNTNSIVSGVSSQGSQVIEIVMDEEEEKASSPNQSGSAPPQQPFGRDSAASHSRGRSENDNSISGRFTRAAERLRSASRGRNTTSPIADFTKPYEPSPYESVPPVWNMNRNAATSPAASNANLSGNGNMIERHPREVKGAMSQEDGGMI
jgi:hypothetical protein